MWRVVWIRPYLCQVFAQAVSLVVSLIYRRPVLELWCCVSKVQYAVLSPMENGTHFKICVLWSWCIFLYGSQGYIILFYLCVFKRRLRISAIYLSTFCVTQPQAKAYFHCCTGAGVGWGGVGWGGWVGVGQGTLSSNLLCWRLWRDNFVFKQRINMEIFTLWTGSSYLVSVCVFCHVSLQGVGCQ